MIPPADAFIFFLFHIRMCHYFYRENDYVLGVSDVGIATTVKSIKCLEFVHPSGGHTGNFGYVWEGGIGRRRNPSDRSWWACAYTVYGVSFYSTRDINIRWMPLLIFPVGNVVGLYSAYDRGTGDGLGSA